MIPTNWVEIHLAINHLPVMGLPFSAALLLAGIVFNNGEWRRAGLWTAVLTGIAVWFVYFSGGHAADAIEGLAGVSDQDVGRHASAAWRFACLTSFVGLAAAAALARDRSEPAPSERASAAVLALVFAAAAVGGWTARRGGLIRHPELRDRGLLKTGV
jgi:hypothetical protein